MLQYRLIINNIDYYIEHCVGDNSTVIYFLNLKGSVLFYMSAGIYKVWYKNKLPHREDGAALIFSNGTKRYYLNGKEYRDIKNDDEWIIKQIIE